MIGTIDINPQRFVSASVAAARLGVSRQTLYTYVSRGLIRASPDPADPRRSLYHAHDVRTLHERQGRGRGRQAVASSTIDWGEPILRSALTSIADTGFAYRGQDAVALSAHATLETVASLLWQRPHPVLPQIHAPIPTKSQAFQRCLTMIATLAATPDATPEAVLATMAAAVSGSPARKGEEIHTHLGRVWNLAAQETDLLRCALVLCADHELNASAYAARVVASTGASLAACTLAGLAALSGPLHGGMTARLRTLADEADVVADPWAAFEQRRAVGTPIPGFGHRLYPAGDPRAKALFALCPPNTHWTRMIEAAWDVTGQHPTIDVALAMLEMRLALPQGSGLALFALGRTVGWLAHALEQRTDGRLIRPRAEHVNIPVRST